MTLEEKKKLEKGRTRKEREAFRVYVNDLLEKVGAEKIDEAEARGLVIKKK